MTWLAGLLVGVTCYLVAGALLGRMPDMRVARFGIRRPSTRRLWLQQAGVGLTPQQFVLGSCLLGVIAFVGVTALTSAPIVAIVPAVGVASTPVAYYGRRRTARLRSVQESWPDGLRDIRASISAGRSLPQALVTLSETGPEPLREAFARFGDLSRMLGTVAALEVIKEELADTTSDRVIEVLILAFQRGGSIVQGIIDDLIATTSRDLKVLEEIETDSLEMRINARAVLVMPWLVLIALTVRAGPFRDFYRTRGGVLVIVFGAVLTMVGYILVTRLARTQSEQRVFGSAGVVRLE